MPVENNQHDACPLDWDCHDGSSDDGTGVFQLHQEIHTAHITDGLSSTYMIGERSLDPNSYYDGGQCANDQGWDLGYDYDVNRWTYYRPHQDTPGRGGCERTFGSAHPIGFNMALCDGSIRRMNYDIAPEIHKKLGNRKDGTSIDPNDL